jgi:hypothetical protein
MCLLTVVLGALPATAEPPSADAPFGIAEGLLDPAAPGLGLEAVPGERVTVWRGAEETHRFSHHPNLVAFGGEVLLMWSNGRVDEDSPGQRIQYSRSKDGLHWSPPETLADDGEGICVATGWVVEGETLVAYYTITGGENFHPDTALYARVSRDARSWGERSRITSGFFIESPRRLPEGRLLLAGESVGRARETERMRLLLTDSPDGLEGWAPARISPADLEAFGYTEPSFFRRPDGTLVAAFRSLTGHLYASTSSDRGRTWSTPVPTRYPDATARFYAGNLPDGRAVLIGNPLERGDRSLLVLATSRDGRTFDRAWLVRGEPTHMSFEGQHKLDGWQYPNALVLGDHLLVAYSVNKEDVGVTKIPLSALR